MIKLKCEKYFVIIILIKQIYTLIIFTSASADGILRFFYEGRTQCKQCSQHIYSL